MTITSMGEINREIANRCRDLGLTLDCGADGLFNAEIAVIAEAPGERERHMKLPLVGSSGKMLWDYLRPIGINRRSVYISNVVKRQLRQVSGEKVSISRNEIDHYASILNWELQQLPNLKYIVVLGNYALEAVTGLTGIQQHRGSVYQSAIKSLSTGLNREVTVVAFLNPAAVMKEPKWDIMFRFDINRLDKVLKGEFTQHEVNTIINPSFNEAIQYIDKLHDEGRPTALDIEVISNETACIGFANNAHEAICINFRDRTRNVYSTAEEIELRKRIQQFGADPNVRLVMQNGMFDSYWLAYKDRILLGPSYFDTMLAHHTLYPSLPHNLGFITSQYTNHPFYKDEGKGWKEGGDIDTFWRYNGKDCCITYAAHEKMLAELKAQSLDKFFFDHVMRLQPHLIGMTVGGIKVDRKLKEEIAESVGKEVIELREKFYEAVQRATGEEDYKPNPSSPKQMSELYFRKLRLVGRGVATDVKNRKRMLDHPRTSEEAKEVIRAQNKWASQAKFFSTYVESQVDEDGQFRCEYKQTGVVSAPGRLSSTSVMWGSGGNLQNQPGRAQKMFIAPEGCGFSYFDLKQAEAQVVGHRAVIETWIEQYAQSRIDSKYDAHRALASVMFNTPYDEVPKEDWEEDEVTPTIRYKAKRCRHGLNYTMGPNELSEQLSVPFREADYLHRTYHKTHPELEAWWKWTMDKVRKDRCLFNAYGRRWQLLERLDPAIMPTLVAFYPQSTIGDKVSRIIYLCENDPDWPKGHARISLNIHDALVALHDLGCGEEVRAVMKRHAEEPLFIEGVDGMTRELVIECDLKASVADEFGIHRWSTLQKVAK
jgi:uracil-DNA glycosylase family 4